MSASGSGAEEANKRLHRSRQKVQGQRQRVGQLGSDDPQRQDEELLLGMMERNAAMCSFSRSLLVADVEQQDGNDPPDHTKKASPKRG